MELTITICTRNRAQLLARAVASLLAEPGIEDQEILIVDNGSTDATPELTEFLTEQSPNIRGVVEDKPGISNARNKAMNEAGGEWLAFLDDDAAVLSGWLDGLLEGLTQPNVSVVGGPIYPDFEVDPPSWFDPQFVLRSYGPEGPLPDSKARTGFALGNAAVKLDVLKEIGGFDPSVGFAPGRVTLGDQYLFGKIYRRFGNVTWNSSKMAMSHRELETKQHPAYVWRRALSNGREFVRFERWMGDARAPGALSMAKMLKQGGEGVVRSVLSLVSPRQRHRVLWNFGTAAGVFTELIRPDSVERVES